MGRRVRRSSGLLVCAVPLLTLAVWLAASLPLASARPDPNDTRTTWSYLQAEGALLRALDANSRRGAIAAEEFAEQLDAQCAGPLREEIGRSTTGNRIAKEMREEIVDAVYVSLLSPDRSGYRSDATAFSRLHWSNLELTDLVHRQGQKAEAISSLEPPDLCADLEAWAASRYTTLPAGVAAFFARIAQTTQSDLGPPERVKGMLRRYEGPRGRSVQAHLERLGDRDRELLETGLGRGLRKLASVLEVAGMKPSSDELRIEPPASVAQEGGKRLEEFDLGRAVAAQSGCLACHRIGDAGNPGPGPDLTHVASRLPGAAIARTLIRPTAPMPSFRNLPRKKFEALVEFLSLLH